MIRPTRLRRLQSTLQRFYGLEPAPDVCAFVRFVEGREAVYLRQNDDDLELAVLLPNRGRGPDHWAQIVEGVSHFLLLAERARVELPASLLELEIQAEVDKFALAAGLAGGPSRSPRPEPTRRQLQRLRQRLFYRVGFRHTADTDEGHRYRVANAVAARFSRRLEADPAPRHLLRRFYRSGLAGKVELAA